MVIVWIVLAVVLIAVEMHHFAFFAMFGAAGALAAAAIAVVAPSVIALQIVVAVVVAAAGIVLVRPFVSRTFAVRGPGVRIGGVHGGLIAARGIAIDEVGSHPTGHVRILGENWLAVSWDDEPIEPTTPVIVMGVTGTTLTVRPPPNSKAELP